jgi:GDP-4-dehydro-6-deoxy-D-mannose reductase
MRTGPTLVTGASGFAGTHLLNTLTTSSTGDVHAWSRPGGQPGTPRERVHWRAVDVLNAESVNRAIADAAPASLYHLAGAAHVGASWQPSSAHLQVHVLGTHYLLDAIRRYAPQCRVLVVTSGMIYRSRPDVARALTEDDPVGPASPYALSKLAEDQLALHAAAADGIDVVVARPFNHIGPGQSPDFAASHFARQIAEIEAGRHAPTLSVGNLEAARDLTDVRDVVAAYLALMQHGHRASPYNVATGVAVSMREVLDRLLALSAVHVTLTQDPALMRPSDIPWVAGDATRLRRHTGWAPTRSLDQTLADLLAYWRQAPGQAG